MESGKVLLGVLAGVAAGALMGILLAPEKGSTTRKQIMDKGDEYTDDLKAKFEDFFSFITGKFDSTKKDAEQLVDKGKANYEETKRDFKNAGAVVKNAIS